MDDPAVPRLAIDAAGIDNVMFAAIDAPYEDTRDAVGFLRSASMTADERTAVAAGNADRVFALQPH